MAILLSPSGSDVAGFTIPDPATFTDITVACWFYPTSLPATDSVEMLAQKQLTSDPFTEEFFFRLYTNTSDETMFNTRIGGSGGLLESTTQLAANTLYHGALTFSDSNDRERLYLNGVNEASNTSQTNSISNTAAALTIGYQAAFGAVNPFTGWVDGFAVWSVELSPDEVAALAAGAVPWRVRPQSLIVCPDMREAAATLNDLSGNGHQISRVTEGSATATTATNAAPIMLLSQPQYIIPIAAAGLSIPVAMFNYRRRRTA